MAGLRAKQKAERHERILTAALGLFRDAGFDAVRIEDIAAEAEVSVGTVYNYFETKGDVLLALVTLEVEEVVEQGAEVVADPPADVAKALDALVGGYYDHSLTYLTKDLWRRAIALTISAPETPFSARYAALDGLLVAQLTELMSVLQQRGHMRGDLSVGVLAEVIFSNLNQAFVDFVRVEAMPSAQLRDRMAAHHRTFAAALAPCTLA